jgi:galactokinase
MIRVTAPGRAGIIGNPTDGYRGTMIACSINNRAEVTIEDSKELIIENQFGRRVLKWKNDYDNQGDYFDVVRSVLRYLKLYDLKAKIRVRSKYTYTGRISWLNSYPICYFICYSGLYWEKI